MMAETNTEQRGDHIYNGLAHFIKGGIFFWYGLLTLGRWSGCFSTVGWAWNVKPPCTRTRLTASIPSAEFVESFVIFLYGSTNMFLEHLAGWGQAWAASDLEHVSISILFFGGGLVRLFYKIESPTNILIVRYACRVQISPEPTQHKDRRNVSTSITRPTHGTQDVRYFHEHNPGLDYPSPRHYDVLPPPELNGLNNSSQTMGHATLRLFHHEDDYIHHHVHLPRHLSLSIPAAFRISCIFLSDFRWHCLYGEYHRHR